MSELVKSSTADMVSPNLYAGRASMMTATRRPLRAISNRLALWFSAPVKLLRKIARSTASFVVCGSSAIEDLPGMVSVGERRPMLEFCLGLSRRLSTYSRKSPKDEGSAFAVDAAALVGEPLVVPVAASRLEVLAWSRRIMYGDIRSCPSISPRPRSMSVFCAIMVKGIRTVYAAKYPERHVNLLHLLLSG